MHFNPFPNFETIPNSKKLQKTTEMWRLKDSIENIVEKGEIANFEQFHFFNNVFQICSNVYLWRKGLSFGIFFFSKGEAHDCNKQNDVLHTTKKQTMIS